MKPSFFKVIRFLTFDYSIQRNKKNSLLVLMFHQVSDVKRSYYPAMPLKAFEELCCYVKKHYTVLDISEVANHYFNNSKPAAVITFDDAHYDILENAWPILSKLGLKFTVNVDTEILETEKPQDFIRVFDMLNHCNLKSYQDVQFMKTPLEIKKDSPLETEAAFVEIMSGLSSKDKRTFVDNMANSIGMKSDNYSKMLSAEDVKFLSSKGVQFGSHSHTHPILTEIEKDQVVFEMQLSKEILENLTGKSVDIFAYPNGIWNEKTEQMAKDCGFKYFLLTEDKINYLTPSTIQKHRYKRVNQYHRTLVEALSHIYGTTAFLRKLLGR